MIDLPAWSREVTGAWLDAAGQLAGRPPAERPPVTQGPSPSGATEALALCPTPRHELMRDGTARLYHFAAPAGAPAPTSAVPLLLIPSLINRWYVLDLRPGGSLVEALVGGGIDTFCLDWGIPEPEDRYLSWDEVLARLARAVRRVRRETGAEQVALLGYCMGGTLATLHAALAPGEIAALVDLAGPIDFAQAGRLGEMVDPRWFDADAVADAGNVSPSQMQSGFAALRPTLELAKLVSQPDQAADPAARAAAAALDTWASDNIPFPGEAYRTYIRSLYQDNALIRGEHVARGKRVALGAIRCPVLAVVAERDHICPPAAAIALTEAVGSSDTAVLRVPGGHVGAVVGRAASREMYPKVLAWLTAKLGTVH